MISPVDVRAWNLRLLGMPLRAWVEAVHRASVTEAVRIWQPGWKPAVPGTPAFLHGWIRVLSAAEALQLLDEDDLDGIPDADLVVVAPVDATTTAAPDATTDSAPEHADHDEDKHLCAWPTAAASGGVEWTAASSGSSICESSVASTSTSSAASDERIPWPLEARRWLTTPDELLDILKDRHERYAGEFHADIERDDLVAVRWLLQRWLRVHETHVARQTADDDHHKCACRDEAAQSRDSGLFPFVYEKGSS